MERPLLPGAVAEPAEGRATLEGIDLRAYWHTLVKRRVAVVVTTALVVVGTIAASLMMHPEYRATAILRIDPEMPKILTVQEVVPMQTTTGRDDFYQTQYMLLRSRSLIRRVVETLHLDQHPAFASGSAASPSQMDPASRLVDPVLGMVQVRPLRRSSLVEVSVDSRDRELAAQVANAICSAYIEMNLETKFEATEAATQFLSTQIESVTREIEQAKQALQEYATKANILSLDERQNITVQQLTELSAALTQAQTDRIQSEAKYRATLRAMGLDAGAVLPAGVASAPAGADLGGVPEVASNPLVQSLRQSLAELESRATEMAQRFKDDWPPMIRLREQVQEMGRQIRTEQWRIVSGLLERGRSEYLAAVNRERALSDKLEEQRRAVSEFNRSSIAYNSLKAEIDNKGALLDSLLKRKNETDVSARLRGLKSSNIRVVDAAETPLAPFRPNTRLNAVLALLFGSLLGLGVALVLEYLDNTIKSVEDVEYSTGLPSLAAIPQFGRSAGRYESASAARALPPSTEASPETQLVTLRDGRSPVSEAYRSLRTSILLSAAGSPPRFLLVTSSQAMEGKTTTVVNTAVALAQAGKKVLLVDGDLRRARCHAMLGVSNRAGFSNFLSGGAPLRELIQATKVPNLFVLASGPLPPNPSELLGSERLRQFVEVIPPNVNHILFDSPPLLSVTDALLIATVSDGVILVARAGKSPRQHLRRAHRMLRDINAKVVGVVLNSVDSRHMDYYAYHSRHYYEGDKDAQSA